MRRNRVVAMTKADIAILKLLYNDGDELRLPPAVIADNIDYSAQRVRERVTPLRKTSCINYYDRGRGVYELDSRGRRFVLGEMTEEEAEALDDDLTEYSG
jgi:predicted transcriptional regulator